MTTLLLYLLKQIADEVIIYEPLRRPTNELREFQNTVHRLREMERLGLSRRLSTQTK